MPRRPVSHTMPAALAQLQNDLSDVRSDLVAQIDRLLEVEDFMEARDSITSMAEHEEITTKLTHIRIQLSTIVQVWLR